MKLLFVMSSLAIIAIATVPHTAAQGPGTFTIEGLTLVAEPNEVTLSSGTSGTAIVRAVYAGNSTLDLAVTAIAVPGGTGFPGSGRPTGDRPSMPAGGSPPRNFTRQPGGFPGGVPGGMPGVEGLTLTITPTSSRLGPGAATDFIVSIDASSEVAAGDYRIVVVLDGGEAGRAMQALALHVETEASQGAPGAAAPATFAVVLVAAVATRRMRESR